MTTRPVVSPVMLAAIALAGVMVAVLAIPGEGDRASGSTATPTATESPTLYPTFEPTPTAAPTPTPVPSVTQEELNAHRAQWAAAGIVNYRYDLTIGCFCEPRTATVVVLNSKTASVTWSDGTAVKEADFLGSIALEYSSIDKMFSTLDSTLSMVYFLEVSFDSTHGYPDDIYINPQKNLADEEHALRVTNFALVDPNGLPKTGGPR